MRTYILVSFWSLAFSLVMRMFAIIHGEYPRVITYKSAGEDVMWLFLSACLAAWASNLLWGWL